MTFAPEQADVADVMLGAGMRAAGEVDVEGEIQPDAPVQILGQLGGVPLVFVEANLQPVFPVQATRPPERVEDS